MASNFLAVYYLSGGTIVDNQLPSRPMIEKLVTLNGTKDKLQEGVCQMMVNSCSAHMASMTEEEKHMLVARVVVKHDVVGILHSVYSQHFTADEVLDMIAFFKSPTGKKYCKAQDAFGDCLTNAMSEFINEVRIDIIKDGFKANLDKTIRDNEGGESPVE